MATTAKEMRAVRLFAMFPKPCGCTFQVAMNLPRHGLLYLLRTINGLSRSIPNNLKLKYEYVINAAAGGLQQIQTAKLMDAVCKDKECQVKFL